jgi:inorganic pyrophosphatase
VYPLDYGYVPGTLAADGHEVDVFRGTEENGLTAALVVRHDGHEELKLLWNVSVEEAEAARDFLRELPYVALVWRG